MKEAYLFCYINTHRGLLQWPIYIPYMATLTPGVNFGNQLAAVIQRLNTAQTLCHRHTNTNTSDKLKLSNEGAVRDAQLIHGTGY